MIEKLTFYIQPIVIEYGAFGVFLAALLEEIIAPIPSPLVPFAAGFLLLPIDGSFLETIWRALFTIAFPVASGLTLGSLVIYGIGYFGGKLAIEKSKRWIGLSWEDLEKTEKRLIRGKGDEIALFILRIIPIVPSAAISGLCGIARYPLRTFATITFLGSFTRALLLGMIGWYTGGLYTVYIETISNIEKYVLIALIILVILFIGWFLFKKNRK